MRRRSPPGRARRPCRPRQPTASLQEIADLSVDLEPPLDAPIRLTGRDVERRRTANGAIDDYADGVRAKRRRLGDVPDDQGIRPARDRCCPAPDQERARSLGRAESRSVDEQSPASWKRARRQLRDLRPRACCPRGGELCRSDRGERESEREKNHEPSHFHHLHFCFVLGVSNLLPASAYVLLPIQLRRTTEGRQRPRLPCGARW